MAILSSSRAGSRWAILTSRRALVLGGVEVCFHKIALKPGETPPLRHARADGGLRPPRKPGLDLHDVPALNRAGAPPDARAPRRPATIRARRAHQRPAPLARMRAVRSGAPFAGPGPLHGPAARLARVGRPRAPPGRKMDSSPPRWEERRSRMERAFGSRWMSATSRRSGDLARVETCKVEMEVYRVASRSPRLAPAPRASLPPGARSDPSTSSILGGSAGYHQIP